MTKHFLLSIALTAAASLPAAAFSPKAMPAAKNRANLPTAPTEKFDGARRLAPLYAGDGSLKADFSIAGADARIPVFAEHFDVAQPVNWVFDKTTEVTWKTKQAGAPGTAKSFSAINPDDVTSLFVEGPYQVYKREKSSAYSPEIELPANASLSFYAGFTLNYDDACRLYLDVISGTDTVAVWNSSQAPGEKPWAWRKIDLPLDAYSGKTVKFRLMYGPGSGDMFQTGGYMGDFYIDDFTVSGVKPVESVDVLTGELINLVDLSQGTPTKWEWSMPGAVPESSTAPAPSIYYKKDGTYAISLTVSDEAGNTDTKTRTAFVKVTGTEPTAKIGTPATFRLSSNRKPLIAPLAPVTFTDASAGFPDQWKWSFTGVDADPKQLTESTEEAPTVSYSFLHDQSVALEVANSHGKSSATAEVTVEYSGVVNNLLPEDKATVFDMEDWGVFPGSNNRKITAYAERFSKPSRPVMIDGAYVYFTRAEAKHISDQIANVGVHLYTSENGKPGKRLDSMWWSVFELDLPSSTGSLVGTAFPFTEAPVVDDEFFIVVDGIPEYNDSCCVSFAMAGFRPEGNTALMLKEGEWIEVPEYFGAAKHTSFMIYPSVNHSVMSAIPVGSPTTFDVNGAAGKLDFTLFSYLGYKTPVESDAEWLRVASVPNGLTLDTLQIAYDALPKGIEARTGHLKLTDGASSVELTVVQSGSGEGGIEQINGLQPAATPSPFADSFRVDGLTPGVRVSVYSLAGTTMLSTTAEAESLNVEASTWPSGVYLLRVGDKAMRIVKR